ncbi:site-specific integrase [Corynebacterium sp. TAE3-ERU12]|uniref:tyrosine-type recombinase/integrase n=1 Tax=Corynebacterium sp. TAE3-ERU12 TaxID=2849491 RepID=UPI001C48AE76|nr:site-specific integrase [Corynebacterium sp. TAE3-ERU12]MBV7296147.1 site-specific integrase [Corynebacterium sp. TAE3-ERU12]
MASITAYTTKSGRRWQAQWTRPDGRRTRTRGFRTKAEAQAWVEEQGHARRHGAWVDPADGRATVGEIGERWLAAQTHLKPSSLRVTRIAWNNHVRPAWGDRRLDDITQTDVQEWVALQPGSASTVRRNHQVLAQVLDAAVADKRIALNPARGVRLPRKPRPKHVYLSMDQVRSFTEECSHYGEIVWVLATTGLRWSELAGLRVEDIDLDARRIHVNRAAVQVGSRIEVGTPKTHERRSVAMPRFVCNMLRPLLEDRDRTEWVWHRPDGTPLPPPTTGSWFFEARNRMQAREPDFPAITPHGLRHVAAGLLVGSGANVKVVQRQLGHSSAAMTLDVYADLFDDDLDCVADTMDNLHSELGEPKVSQIRRIS